MNHPPAKYGRVSRFNAEWAFGGFQVSDPRTWQQRQRHLNSMGIDTTGWGRAEIMRGVKNKA